MAADGFATNRGRRAALLHRDEVNRRLHARRGVRMLAITSGGAIPEVADYRVVLDPTDTFIGTLNEDFAIESLGGDVFQLGNASWRVLQVGPGVVRVADAKGAPPNLPFWLGEAPARSDELSRAVSDLRLDVERTIAEGAGSAQPAGWLAQEAGISLAAAEQVVAYLDAGRRALGAMPTQDTLVLERFFDESGGTHIVLHAPFGSRINKAWGLALRKRFCRQFDFELQAAATDEALLLSLGPQHSFPLADVFRYLHPATARDVLIQAFLDAPVFQTRWRWNTTISLAVPRNRGGKKVPPQLQRMLAGDLLASAFPDATACLDNMPGDRRIPDHPLVAQTIRDCLEEAMDFDGLAEVLERIQGGALRLVSLETAEPSPLAHEIINARPYAFLDDAPLEERRTQAVQARRAGEASTASDLGRLDAAAIERVRDEARPDPRDVEELHDALVTAGFLTARDLAVNADALFDRLMQLGRAALVNPAMDDERAVWVAAERLPEFLGVHPNAVVRGHATPPPARTARALATRRGHRRDPARPARVGGPDHDCSAGGILRNQRGGCGRRRADARRERSRPAREVHGGGGSGSRMVRPSAARTDSPLHVEPPQGRDRAGQSGRLHAISVCLAARRSIDAPHGAGWPALHRRDARRVRARSERRGNASSFQREWTVTSDRCSICCASLARSGG